MKWSARTTGAWQQALDIEVPTEEVERRLEEVARGIQRRASLPGFRRGRVPLDLVRHHFAESLEQEFLEAFVPRVTSEAVDEARLNPVVPPLVRNLRFTPGQPLRFEALVDVRPEIVARDYRGIPVRRQVRPVDEPAVETVLQRLREESAVFVDLARPAQRGDVVLADSVRLDANGRRLPSTRARNLRLELGAPDLVPDLENGLLGAEAGQERTVEIAYPSDYRVPELAGKRARYLVRVRKIQEKKLRDLDDNLAREVFQLQSLEELRSRVRLNLEGDERVRVQREVEGAIIEELIRRNPFDLPERLVEWTLERVLREVTGTDRPVQEPLKRELEQRYRPGVERSLKREVLLEAVARQEKLEASEEEVAGEIDRMAQADPRQAARVRARYQSADRRKALQESLLERKALEWLMNVAEVQEEVVRESQLVIPATR
ncbi:MAG TPA: trigger factor [Candidatus Eisenbacteria bacterium]|jgi:trigger factor